MPRDKRTKKESPTGVPGSGKTLAGLNTPLVRSSENRDGSVFVRQWSIGGCSQALARNEIQNAKILG